MPKDAHLTSREPGGGTRMWGSCCPTASVPVSSRSASAPVAERTARKSPPARRTQRFGKPHPARLALYRTPEKVLPGLLHVLRKSASAGHLPSP